jgi:hypothetical protein
MRPLGLSAFASGRFNPFQPLCPHVAGIFLLRRKVNEMGVAGGRKGETPFVIIIIAVKSSHKKLGYSKMEDKNSPSVALCLFPGFPFCFLQRF